MLKTKTTRTKRWKTAINDDNEEISNFRILYFDSGMKGKGISPIYCIIWLLLLFSEMKILFADDFVVSPSIYVLFEGRQSENKL